MVGYLGIHHKQLRNSFLKSLICFSCEDRTMELSQPLWPSGETVAYTLSLCPDQGSQGYDSQQLLKIRLDTDTDKCSLLINDDLEHLPHLMRLHTNHPHSANCTCCRKHGETMKLTNCVSINYINLTYPLFHLQPPRFVYSCQGNSSGLLTYCPMFVMGM